MANFVGLVEGDSQQGSRLQESRFKRPISGSSQNAEGNWNLVGYTRRAGSLSMVANAGSWGKVAAAKDRTDGSANGRVPIGQRQRRESECGRLSICWGGPVDSGGLICKDVFVRIGVVVFVEASEGARVVGGSYVAVGQQKGDAGRQKAANQGMEMGDRMQLEAIRGLLRCSKSLG